MLSLSFRARITALNLAVLVLSFAAFALVSDYGFRHSIGRTVNDASRANLNRIQGILIRRSSQGPTAIRSQLDTLARLWADASLFEVRDGSGHVIYQSAPFTVPSKIIPPAAAPGTAFYTANLHYRQYRIAARAVPIGGQRFVIRAAVPTEPFDQALDRFRRLLREVLPVLILLASVLTYWFSGRGIAPLNDIIRTAGEIGVNDLTTRLKVPKTHDELHRLTNALNQMLTRIESSVRRITQFTADASHDLRTPLALIRGNAELALRRSRTSDEYRDALRTILRTTEEATGLVENLLALARADAGAATLQFRRLDLMIHLRKAASEAGALASGQGIRVVQELPSGPVWITADSAAIERLFRIVFENAVKYTPSGGEVGVFFHNGGQVACVEIRDTGIGIPPNDLPHIFERFYRADRARSRETGGSGLGLAIARWVVEMHRGSITAQSVLGEGSVFSIVLPLPHSSLLSSPAVNPYRPGRASIT